MTKPSREALLADIDPIIRAHAFSRLRQDAEDGAQEGRIAAMRAYDTYDDTREVPLRAWCILKAKYAVITHYRATYGSRRQSLHAISLDTLRDPEDGHTVYEPSAVDDPAFEHFELSHELESLRATCTDAEREVIDLTLAGLNRLAVGQARGHSESRTTQIIKGIGRRARAGGWDDDSG